MTDRARTFQDRSRRKRYSSFLLRCWHVGQGELRIKIEHIQSGDSTQVDTYEAAVAWLSEHCEALRDREESRSHDGAPAGPKHEAGKEIGQM